MLVFPYCPVIEYGAYFFFFGSPQSLYTMAKAKASKSKAPTKKATKAPAKKAAKKSPKKKASKKQGKAAKKGGKAKK